MTLVVARKQKRFISIVGDTKLTYHFRDSRSLRDGVVKITLLSPTMCIAFAGNIHHAEIALQRLGNTSDLALVRDTLIQVHLNSGMKTDFIIGNINHEAQSSSLILVRDGETLESDIAWIGSRSAFAKFQERFHDGKSMGPLDESITNLCVLRYPDGADPDEQHLYSRMFGAMHAIIEDDAIQEVDGFVTPVAVEGGQFSYMIYMMAFRPPITDTELNRDGTPTPIGWGNAENGSFCVNLIGDTLPVLAVHFYQGNVGVIYRRRNYGLMEPDVRINIDEIDFFSVLKTKFGLGGGLEINHTVIHFAKKGHSAFQNNEFAAAVELFDEAMRIASREWGDRYDGQRKHAYLSEFGGDGGEVRIPEKDTGLIKRILYYRGRSLMRLGHFDRARLNFHEALTIDQNYAAARKQLAVSYYQAERLDEAEREFNAYVGRHPGADSYYSRGAFFYLTRRFDEARDDLASALSFDLDHQLAQTALLRLLAVTTIQG